MSATSLRRPAALPRQAHPVRQGIAARAWWPWARRALWGAFFVAVGILLVNQARTIHWDEVAQTLRSLPPSVLLLAGALAFASHLLYATFDLIGRHATGHRLPVPTVMGITFVSYAFNLNFGALVGSVASRYRLYGRLGLDHLQIARILGLSLATNWLGYLLLGGLAFALFPPALPADWHIAPGVLRIAGALLAAAALGYLALCAVAGAAHRSLRLRGHTFRLPSGRMAALQLALSCANWALIAAAIHVLLRQQVDYPTVLAVLLLAAVAGVVTHVPAGLGVLEAVFVALLGTQLAPATLIGTLLAYRALYYLAPLALAVVLFLFLELRHRQRPRDA
ncbi:lysylphosphatidylglycerol synthase domain-containing protein [Pseudorhodoferax sp.]|uniref:lysylphosphatidylglycerol synthase domain-containing protein n=1 Tax=Pseudorhodoferax sp. TaxID=1993553 RepID=UPI0039E60475